MANRPNGAFTWGQILAGAKQANEKYGAWMPQQWIDYLNEALCEMPSQPSQSPVSREEAGRTAGSSSSSSGDGGNG